MTDVNEIPMPPPVTPRRSPLRRIGCTIALVLWFALLLLPCFLIVMATQGEITIAQGELPGQQLRVWLIMEAEQRGLGVSSATVYRDGDNGVCVQTDTRFWLWQGAAEPVSYCECYERATAESVWSPTVTESGLCRGAG